MLKKFSTHKQERKHIRMSTDFALPLIGNAPYMKRRLWIFGFFAFQVDMNRFCIAVSLESPSRIYCCDMGQNDTIGKIELNPSIVLSSDNTNCKNDIQLFHQLFDELSVYRDYH